MKYFKRKDMCSMYVVKYCDEKPNRFWEHKGGNDRTKER